MEGPGKIAVFDLDGTLYRGASFRKYLFWASSKLFKRGLYFKSFMLMWRFALSKAGVVSHKRMKHRNSLLLEHILSEADNQDFTDILLHGLNREVLGFMHRLQGEGYLTVLSTASPESYCRLLGERLGFDVCQATPEAPSHESDYVENRGMRKLEKVRILESQTGKALDIVVTDHHDDLPLLEANVQGKNYLVAPSRETSKIVGQVLQIDSEF